MIIDYKERKNIDGEELVKEYVLTRSQKVKEQAMLAYMALVKHIVGRINILENGVLKREDLYQYGIVGLLSALEKFQLEFGASFKTFAYKRIYGEVMDAIRKTGTLNRKQAKDINRILTATGELSTALMRDPTPVEVCEEIGITEDEYYHIQQFANLNFTLSLDEKVFNDGENSLTREDMIADETQIPPDVVLEKQGIKEELKKLIKELPERQRLILALYYYEELTLFDIGQVLGISESRVSQILNQVLIDLRGKMKL
ncbi:MAG: FliA/WhiG family RNA polymerase sigma factor [Candidatus Marinimicrobia bacterium]|nr:FliA/WhiG family RNA polymerase sigma factor [Candidatus Neomarinimicrobiota bacterium]